MEKEDGTQLLAEGVQLLAAYQDRLAAQDTNRLLLCLQGLDASGKDSTIRHVMSGVNPQGVRVSSFKVPSSEELRHDYLWRYEQRLPARGEIGVFNRSHYEEVLVVRVHPELLEPQHLTARRHRKGPLEAPLRRDEQLGALPDRQRDTDPQGAAQHVKGGAAPALPAPPRPSRPPLEVLDERHPRTRLLGRLPERLLGHALSHQYASGRRGT